MAIEQMKCIRLCGLKKDRKKILEWLQLRGDVEVMKPALHEDSIFKEGNPGLEGQRSTFSQNIKYADDALKILDAETSVKKPLFSSLDGKKEATAKQYESFSAKHDRTVETAKRIEFLEDETAQANADILKIEVQLEALKPWFTLDVPLDFQGTKSTAAFIGTMPNQWTYEEIAALLAQNAPQGGPAEAEIISSSPEQTCVFVLCEKKHRAEVEKALAAGGFSRPPIHSEKTPKEQSSVLEKEISAKKDFILNKKSTICECAKFRSDLEFLADYDSMRYEKYGVINRLMQGKRTFFLFGYIPAGKAASFEQELSHKFDAAVEFDDPPKQEEPPVLLKNNNFASPMEGVLEAFSLPGIGEIDPSAIMAVFYYFLFGMMLGDAAYGIIMMAITAVLLHKHKHMAETMQRTLRMFFFCGISTTFWGFMFGSFFGDAVGVISKTFFNSNVALPPIWFEPINKPMKLLVFCFLVGLIHLFTGLGINFYQSWKAKKYKDAIYDVVFWYMLVGGLVVLLLSIKGMTGTFGISFTLPSSVGNAAGWVAAVGAIGIVLTGGRSSRNPFKRFLKGLYSLYNITGYLSDVLSYSRLLALGLATSVIASVVNKMAAMAGGKIGGFIGVIIFIVIFLVGHTMNILINMLGAYVHTNRLQYVEFFGKFYSGGGKKFTPFSADCSTKYYQFKEERKS